MNPLKAYKQQEAGVYSRIDMLLALYDGAITRLERAVGLLRGGKPDEAKPLLARVQMIVMEMAAGINMDVGDSNSPNLLRLYEFVVHSIAEGGLENLEGSLEVLRTLQEGFVAIRPEAVQLERSGQLPCLDAPRTIAAMG
jgi:flagellin-specific chaperone FliS